jgi:GDPmannose 4,6-dehydratase
MLGTVRQPPQNEQTPFHPRSPYGVAKVYAHYITVNSPREPTGSSRAQASCSTTNRPGARRQFVTRKVTDGVARIKAGLVQDLRLGNRDAKRDRGFAGDYVQAMWLMPQQFKPNRFVVATGETHTVARAV